VCGLAKILSLERQKPVEDVSLQMRIRARGTIKPAEMVHYYLEQMYHCHISPPNAYARGRVARFIIAMGGIKLLKQSFLGQKAQPYNKTSVSAYREGSVNSDSIQQTSKQYAQAAHDAVSEFMTGQVQAADRLLYPKLDMPEVPVSDPLHDAIESEGLRIKSNMKIGIVKQKWVKNQLKRVEDYLSSRSKIQPPKR